MSNPRLELVGKRFGELVVLAPAGTTPKNESLWLCKCNRCGKESIIVGHRLAKKKNCGCLKKQKYADISGQTFGALEVLRRVGTGKSGDKLYLCRCKMCGQEKTFPANTIKAMPKSCGCTRYNPERMRDLARKGAEATTVDGVQVYTATREEPNRNNVESGYRWVRVIKRKPRNFIYVQFHIKGKRYYKGGFATIESAHEWAKKAHADALSEMNVRDLRKGENHE